MREGTMDLLSTRTTRGASQHILTRATRCLIELLETRYLMSAVISTFPIPGSDPDNYYGSGKIVAGRDGNYWFADTSDNAIGRVTPQGQVTLFPLPAHRVPADDGTNAMVSDDPEPMDVVLGPNGNIWFTESAVDRIGEINVRGKITEFRTPSPDSYPEGLAVGSDGNLWFGETGTDSVAKITPAGRITEYVFDDLHIDYDGLVEGSDGNIWFLADDGDDNSAIASIAPDGVVNFYSLALPQSDGSMAYPDPTSLAAGPDGNLWIGTASYGIEQMTTTGALTSFPIPEGDSVTSIEAGTGGKLWIALTGNDQFGFITTSGAVSTFTLPETSDDSDNADISMSDLTEGPDGSLWFVDSTTPQAGTIDLAAAPFATGNTVNVVAGTPQTSTLGSFIDLAGPSDASDYTATITLDDGTLLPGTVVANNSGGFDVATTSSWPIGPGIDAEISIVDNRDQSRVATALASVNAAAPLAMGTGIYFAGDAVKEFSGQVSSFTGVLLDSLGAYSALISWGDGTSTMGTVTANAAGGIDISGSHTYGFGGTYPVVTLLSTGGSPNSNIVSVANIAAPPRPPALPPPPPSGGGTLVSIRFLPTFPEIGIPLFPSDPTPGSTTTPLAHGTTGVLSSGNVWVVTTSMPFNTAVGDAYIESMSSSLFVASSFNLDAMTDSMDSLMQNVAFTIANTTTISSTAKGIHRSNTVTSTVSQAASHSVSLAKIKSSDQTEVPGDGGPVSGITKNLGGIFFIPAPTDASAATAISLANESSLFSGPVAALNFAPSNSTASDKQLIVTAGRTHHKAGTFAGASITSSKAAPKPTAQVVDALKAISPNSVLS